MTDWSQYTRDAQAGSLGGGGGLSGGMQPGTIMPASLGGGGLSGLPMPPGTTFNNQGSPQFSQLPSGSPEQAALINQIQAPSPMDQILGIYGSYYGPQTQALQSQGNSLNERQQAQGQYYSQSSDAAQRDYQAKLGLLGIDQRGNAIDQASISKLLGLYGQQTGQYRSLYDAQNAQARAQGAQQTFDLNSKTTAQGGWGSEGQRTGLGTIDTLMNQAINANESQFSIAKNQNDISTERLQAQKASLANIAGSYGLKADQLKASLDGGLAKLGLDNIMNSGQLADMITSNDVQQATLARTIIDQALNTPQNVLDYLQQNPSVAQSLVYQQPFAAGPSTNDRLNIGGAR